MPHSKVVNAQDKDIASRIFQRLHRIENEALELTREKETLVHLRDNVAKVCKRCGGSGTVCEGRTADDMPDYRVCTVCEGKGHGRSEAR